MFVRPCYRRKNGKRHAYWALMESYRTQRGPRQRVVAYLGQLDARGRLGVQEAAEGRGRGRQKRLFDDVRPQWVEVDAARVRVERRARTSRARRSGIRWRSEVIHGTIGPTASRSALRWWSRGAGCRWGTKCSPATATT
jgi:hypothetical protein